MSDVTREQFVAGLVSQHGATRENAERAADRKFGPRESQDRVSFLRVVGPELAFPIRIQLPWSALCSDNDKYVPAMRGNRPVLILTEQYRRAKQKTRERGVQAMTVDGQRFPPLDRPLALTARVWVPDNRAGHDVANFGKCAHDALEKVVYTKDEWLHDVRWIRCGVDVDHPRAELTIAPAMPVIAPALDPHSISRDTL